MTIPYLTVASSSFCLFYFSVTSASFFYMTHAQCLAEPENEQIMLQFPHEDDHELGYNMSHNKECWA